MQSDHHEIALDAIELRDTRQKCPALETETLK
jgi:hypothetical protein